MNYMKTTVVLALASFAILHAEGQTKTTTVKKPATQKTAVKKPATTKTAARPAAKPVVKKEEKIPGVRVKITTDSGVMVLRLYDKTPLHRDNFIKLANEHFFDSLLFHRVIQGFMIQGGDPQSKYAPAGQMLGSGDIGYTIPAEFDSTLFHKKGALAAARTNNPTKASSGCQFYIVQGKTYSDDELNMLETQRGAKMSNTQRMIYKTQGGTPFLDMNYTVFGELESGFEVIDKIASVPKAYGDRPNGDVRMYIEVMK